MEHRPNVKLKTVTTLENKYRRKYRWPWVGPEFLHTAPKAQSIKEESIKIEKFGSVKDIKRSKRKATEGRKYLLTDLYPKKSSSNSTRRQTTLTKKWAKDQNRHLIKEDIQMKNKLMKWCTTLPIISAL